MVKICVFTQYLFFKGIQYSMLIHHTMNGTNHFIDGSHLFVITRPKREPSAQSTTRPALRYRVYRDPQLHDVILGAAHHPEQVAQVPHAANNA